MNITENRKDEHVKISVEENVLADYNFWDDIKLIHNALPEINKDEIDLSTELFKKKLGAPIIISSMTGGYKKAKQINKNLAIAAEKYQIGMGVGSQRAALENPKLADTYEIIKDYDIPIRFANIGASQIVIWGHKNTIKNAYKMIDMIDANAFIICLNFLQEAVQPEGEAHAKGCIDAIKKIAEELPIPVVIKESGAGISFDVAERLSKIKIGCIDVGGLGGTSFSAIEHYRAKIINDKQHTKEAKTFWNWGIPTPKSIIEVGEATKWKIPIIATGGIRNGIDVAKAIALGADCAGIAGALIEPATKSEKDVLFEVDTIINELKSAMFLTGVKDISNVNKIGVELWI